MKKYRIGKLMALAMIAVGLVIDLVIQPGFYALFGSGVAVNRAISAIGGVIFGAWYWLLGVKITEPKNLTIMAVCMLLELIPFTDVLPAFTAGVAMTITRTAAVDKLNQKKIALELSRRQKLMQIRAQQEVLQNEEEIAFQERREVERKARERKISEQNSA